MNRFFLRAAFVAVLGISTLCFGNRALAGQCSDSISRSSPVISNGFAFNLSNTRNNASQITSANVASLQLAFSHAAVGSTEKRGAPAMTQQAIFFSAGPQVIAMNRVSGCQYWSYTVPAKGEPMLGPNVVRSSSVYYLNEGGLKPALVLVGDRYGSFYAINAVTGSLVWSEFIGEDPHDQITGGAQFYNGKLLVPVASHEVLTSLWEFGTQCCKSHGILRALNPYTGSVIWTYDTAPAATLDPTLNKYAPNGMSLWGTPAIDPVRGSVYIGTGQNLTPPVTDNSDAIVALDINTGTRKWAFQGTAGDAWNIGCQSIFKFLAGNCLPSQPGGYDYDFGAPPILVHLSNGKDAIIAGEKSGMLYSLDPNTGAVNWSRRLGAGGNLGGIHWGMAVDATRVYVGVSDFTSRKVSGLGSAVPNRATVDVNVGTNAKPSDNATPGVYAVDLATGNVVWEQHPTHVYADAETGPQTIKSIYSAAVSVTNDVVFAASIDGVLLAFRTTDGARLWSFDAVRSFTDVNGNPGNGGTIDSVGAVPGGTDLLLNSGYSTFGQANKYQSGSGNALYLFRLP